MNISYKSEQLYRYLDLTDTIVVALDPQGAVRYINQNGCEILEFEQQGLIGRDWFATLLPEEELAATNNMFQQLLAGNTPHGEFAVNTITTESGKEIGLSWRNTVLHNDTGAVQEVVLCGKDITEWQRLETALRASEERFSTIADSSYDWEEWLLPDRTFEYVSPSCEWITGYSVDEFMHHPGLMVTIVHPEDRERYIQHQTTELTLERSKAELYFRIVRKDGDIRWIWHQCQPVFATGGTWLGRRTSNRDVTILKEAENKLIQQQQLFHSGPTIIFKWRAEEGWPVEYVSPNIRDIFGYDPQDLLNGKIPFVPLIHPDDLQRIMAEVDEHSKSGRDSFDQEYRLIDALGMVRWVYDKTTVLRSDSGQITHYLGYLLDVTQQRKTENAVRQSEARLKLALNMAQLGYWSWEKTHDSFFLSEGLYAILGLDSAFFRVSRKSMLSLVYPDDREKVVSFFRKMSGEGETNSIEFRSIHPQGHLIILRAEYEDMSDGDGNHVGRQGVCQDITSIRDTENKLLLSNQIFSHTIEGIAVTDREGCIQSVNPAASKITGYKASELIGKTPRVFKSDRHPAEFYQEMWGDLLQQGFWQGEVWNRRKNGEVYPEWLNITSVKDVNGEITEFISVFHDITEVKEQEEVIRYQANHDALTSLPNRTLLLDRLKMSLRHARQAGKKVAVVYVDLDNFKNINDSLGHTVGDSLLKQAADRIQYCVRPEDTVARHGGDEFVIIQDYLSDLEVTVQTADKIIELFHTPFEIEGNELFVSVSIGIASFPEDGEGEDVLISNADLAMHRAKKQGKNRYCLYTKELNEQVSRRLALGNRLHRALENDEFIVHYQPKFSLKEQKIIGFEALVRWQPDLETIISPLEFIPLAEQTGLIVPIGKFVLETACQQAVLWQEQGFSLTIAVNLSTVQFQQPDFLKSIETILQTSGLPPSLLELEITESLMMENAEIAIDYLWKIKNMGIGVSVDDFGTGYSSLSYLKKLPIDTLKIDRSFVQNLPEDEDDAVITSTIISMAKHLGLSVVAEGVETSEQCLFLQENGCMIIQGYLLSPPQPAKACDELLLKTWESIG